MKNKKMLILRFVILVILVILCCLLAKFFQMKKDKDTMLNEYSEIFELLKEYSFDTADIKDSKIYLYDSNQKLTNEIEVENIHAKVMYIQNRESNMIFWYKGFDDLEGIMFIKNSWEDDVWNGLMRIEKFRGNAYIVYSTL